MPNPELSQNPQPERKPPRRSRKQIEAKRDEIAGQVEGLEALAKQRGIGDGLLESLKKRGLSRGDIASIAISLALREREGVVRALNYSLGAQQDEIVQPHGFENVVDAIKPKKSNL